MKRRQAYLLSYWFISLLGSIQYFYFIHTSSIFIYEEAFTLKTIEAFLWVFIIIQGFGYFYFSKKTPGSNDFILSFNKVPKLFSAVFFLLLLLSFPILVIVPSIIGVFLELRLLRLFFLVTLILISSLFLNNLAEKKTWNESFIFSAVLFGVVYYVSTYIPITNDYPLSIEWSETSRFYHAFTFVSKIFIGKKLPWPHYDPFRHMIQAIPFLFGNISILYHRIWQNGLPILISLILGIGLSRRLKIETLWIKAIYILWASLYIFQGRLYLEVLLISVVMIFGYNNHNVFRSTILVLVMSLIGGLTRINWLPMPAIFAIGFYLLETPFANIPNKRKWNYFKLPLIWMSFGLILGLISLKWYQVNSGQIEEIFTYYIRSDLLWHRLLPNVSFQFGVLLTVLFATFPIIYCLSFFVIDHRKSIHPIRLYLAGAILILLFLGGVLVSAKIGGGVNIHNFDAYMLTLLIFGSYIFFGKVSSSTGEIGPIKPNFVLMTLIVLIPLFVVSSWGGQAKLLDSDSAFQAIQTIQDYIDLDEIDNDLVLFISQRHLLILDYIKNVEIIPEYEKVILMEAAMSNTKPYLDSFAEDIRSQKYSMIVSDPIRIRIINREEKKLLEEQDIYNEKIGSLIKCYYTAVEKFNVGIEIYIPKNSPTCNEETQ